MAAISGYSTKVLPNVPSASKKIFVSLFTKDIMLGKVLGKIHTKDPPFVKFQK